MGWTIGFIIMIVGAVLFVWGFLDSEEDLMGFGGFVFLVTGIIMLISFAVSGGPKKEASEYQAMLQQYKLTSEVFPVVADETNDELQDRLVVYFKSQRGKKLKKVTEIVKNNAQKIENMVQLENKKIAPNFAETKFKVDW